LTTYNLSDQLIGIVRESAMSKSKMIGGRPPFRITANLLSPRVKAGDWNACFGMHGRHRIIPVGDREKNIEDRLHALAVIRIHVAMDVSDNRNESIHEK
jgi:hypothetical protein